MCIVGVQLGGCGLELWKGMLMSRAYWRSPEKYKEIQSLDAPGFAFQFVSRDLVFIEERERLQLAASRNALDPADADAFARRWGLRFRKNE